MYTFIPKQVAGLPTSSQVAAADDYSLIMTSTGKLYHWGRIFGSANQLTAVALEPTLTVSKISAGFKNAGAMTSAGKLYIWGYNDLYVVIIFHVKKFVKLKKVDSLDLAIQCLPIQLLQ